MTGSGSVMTRLSPIAMGYLPVGISFAVIAAEIGLSSVEIVLMSVFVLGASSQIAAIPLIDAGDSLIYIFMLTFLLNSRHVALAASLAPSLSKFSSAETASFSYGLTDESYTIHALDIERETFQKRPAIAINWGTHAIWVLSTVVGCVIGVFFLRYTGAVRIDFALVAMFAFIVVSYIKLNSGTDGTIRRGKLCRLLSIALSVAVASIVLDGLGLKGLAIVLPAVIAGVAVYAAAKLQPRDRHDGEVVAHES